VFIGQNRKEQAPKSLEDFGIFSVFFGYFGPFLTQHGSKTTQIFKFQQIIEERVLNIFYGSKCFQKLKIETFSLLEKNVKTTFVEKIEKIRNLGTI